MADERTSGVYPMGELDDFKVADGDVDPRGWTVYSQDGQQLGEVKDLLVDTAAMKVRYLEVELDRARGDTRHVLFPVGTARVDDRDDRVFVNATAESVTGLPTYTRGGPVSRDHENSVRSGFVTAAGTTAGTDADAGEITAAELDYYNHQHYDTGHFYGSRGRSGDAADMAGDMASEERMSNAAAGDQEITMPVRSEELVVGKRPVVTEEIVIRKRASVDNQTVDADVRRERVEVERDTPDERP